MVITSNLNLCEEVCSGYNLEYVICPLNFWIMLWVMCLKIAPCLSKYFIDIYSYLTFKAFDNKHFEAFLVKFTRRCILYLWYEYIKVKLVLSIKLNMLYLLILFPTRFVFLTALHTSCISCPSVAIWSSPTPPHSMFGIKIESDFELKCYQKNEKWYRCVLKHTLERSELKRTTL